MLDSGAIASEIYKIVIRETDIPQVGDYELPLNTSFARRDWDDDLTVGAVSLAETVEFFRELDMVGYDGWLAVDITPYSEDAIAACQLCLDMAMDCR
ncbi:MAG TPA: hypothetical protein ENL03_03115 [Phycisphaerae bacterium]|nr:hypothetical protein [Phycisphaerae bacterium]